MTITRIVQLARKYMEHDMISQYTDLPAFPEARARLLHGFLLDKSDGDRELYTLAVSLAQLGLETHDLIEAQGDSGLALQARSRQLKVLAGDYFNGKFYQLLSGEDRTDIVRLVSRAICEVSALKAGLYEKLRQLKLTAEEFLDHSAAIRCQLFLALIPYVPSRYKNSYTELIRGLACMEALGEEIDRSKRGHGARGFAFLHIWQHGSTEDRQKALGADENGMKALAHKYRIYGHLTDLLQSQVAIFQSLVSQFDSDPLKSEISRILEPFYSRLSVHRVAEEV